MGSQARVTQYQVTHFVRGTVAYNSNGVTTGIVIGHIPSGARLSSADVYVETAFNGTGQSISLGLIPELNGTLTTAPAAQSNLVSGVATGTAAYIKNTPPITAAVVPQDQAVVVSVPGTAGTAGVATVVCTYFPNL